MLEFVPDIAQSTQGNRNIFADIRNVPTRPHTVLGMFLLAFSVLCMYLPQAASLPQLLGIERDLFRCRHLVKEVELELAVVGCSVVVPLFPATPLQQRQVCKGKIGPFLRRIARDYRPLPSALGLTGTNPAHQAVGRNALYL